MITETRREAYIVRHRQVMLRPPVAGGAFGDYYVPGTARRAEVAASRRRIRSWSGWFWTRNPRKGAAINLR
jgi:hypothetical protein